MAVKGMICIRNYIQNQTEDSNGSGMKTKDDPQALNTIEHYKTLLKDQHQPVTCEKILGMATSDPDLEPMDLSRIKAQLVELVRLGELKSVKEVEG